MNQLRNSIYRLTSYPFQNPISQSYGRMQDKLTWIWNLEPNFLKLSIESRIEKYAFQLFKRYNEAYSNGKFGKNQKIKKSESAAN
jgi:hypothetical protein